MKSKDDKSGQSDAGRIVRFQIAFIVVSASIMLAFVFLSASLVLGGWVSHMQETGTLGDFLWFHSLPAGEGPRERTIWIDVALLLLLFLVEIIVWGALFLSVCAGAILGHALFLKPFLSKTEFKQVFGEPEGWDRLCFVGPILSKVMSRIIMTIPGA